MVIFYYLFVLGAAASRVLTVALGLIMAGAMGNCYDRLVLGHVRDFVHFHVDAINFDCAIFNFADNMLVAGACTLVLYALRPEEAAAGPVDRSPGVDGPEAVDGNPIGVAAVAVDVLRLTTRLAGDGCRYSSASWPTRRSKVRTRRGAGGPGCFDFVGLLVPDPGVDDVGSEDIAAEQEIVVGPQGIERGFERPRSRRDRCRALRAEGRRYPYRAARRAAACSGFRRGSAMSIAENSR